MKAYKIIIIPILCFLFTACSSNQHYVNTKYISVYNNDEYLILNKDGTFQNSGWTIVDNGVEKINDAFIYTIDKNNIITVIDTTQYAGQDSLNKYEFGAIYKDYICVLWDGKISNKYSNMTFTSNVGDLLLTYNLKEDKTYEYTVTYNNNIVNSETGTYSINNNKIVCANDIQQTIFIDINGDPYCVEYIKQ